MWYFYILIGLLVFFAFTVRVITYTNIGVNYRGKCSYAFRHLSFEYKLPNEKGGAAFYCSWVNKWFNGCLDGNKWAPNRFWIGESAV